MKFIGDFLHFCFCSLCVYFHWSRYCCFVNCLDISPMGSCFEKVCQTPNLISIQLSFWTKPTKGVSTRIVHTLVLNILRLSSKFFRNLSNMLLVFTLISQLLTLFMLCFLVTFYWDWWNVWLKCVHPIWRFLSHQQL